MGCGWNLVLEFMEVDFPAVPLSQSSIWFSFSRLFSSTDKL